MVENTKFEAAVKLWVDLASEQIDTLSSMINQLEARVKLLELENEDRSRARKSSE